MQGPKVGIGVIILKNNKVLLGKRKSNHGKGSWSFPGGHLEAKEEFLDCAVRETKEETGLEIKNLEFAALTNDIYEEENKHYITIFIKAEHMQDEPKLLEPEKWENWEWFDYDNLPTPLFKPIENLKKQNYNPIKDKPVIGPQVVCSLFLEKNNKFLIVLDPRFKVWRIPGGRAEKKESLIETLQREMKEELNLEIKDPKFLGYAQDNQYHFKDQENKSRLLMFFHAKTELEPKIDPDEAYDHKWVTIEELKNLENKEQALTKFLESNQI